MSVQRISPETLQSWLQGPNPPAVVDVRDEDHVGGHVRGSVHAPSANFLNMIPQVQEETSDADRVVFYCQLSQQRGPSCASHYARRPPPQHAAQQVYVLDGGFSNWAYTFSGKDEFTEDFISGFYD